MRLAVKVSLYVLLVLTWAVVRNALAAGIVADATAARATGRGLMATTATPPDLAEGWVLAQLAGVAVLVLLGVVLLVPEVIRGLRWLVPTLRR